MPVRRTRLRPLLRADRALAGARRVPAGRQPARARAVRAAVHRELPLAARARHSPDARGPRLRRGDRAASPARRASPSTTSTPTSRTVRSCSTCAPTPTRASSRTYSRAPARGQACAGAKLTRLRLDLDHAQRHQRAALATQTSSCRASTTRASASAHTAMCGVPASGPAASWRSVVKVDNARAQRAHPRRSRAATRASPFRRAPRRAGGGRRRAADGRARRRRRAARCCSILDAADLQEIARAEGAAPHPVRLPRTVRTRLNDAAHASPAGRQAGAGSLTVCASGYSLRSW